MKLFFGIIFYLIIITISVGAATKIEIYEIRENDNGLQLKNLNSNPKENRNVDPLLKLLRVPKPKKPENKVFKFAEQLLSKLKSLRGEEYVTKFNDDAQIYILNSDDLNDDSSDKETLFIDKTRNDRASSKVDQKDIRNLLLQLLQPERTIPLQRKSKLREKRVQTLEKPALRTDDDEIVPSKSNTRPRYAYEYLDDSDGQHNIDKGDQ